MNGQINNVNSNNLCMKFNRYCNLFHEMLQRVMMQQPKTRVCDMRPVVSNCPILGWKVLRWNMHLEMRVLLNHSKLIIFLFIFFTFKWLHHSFRFRSFQASLSWNSNVTNWWKLNVSFYWIYILLCIDLLIKIFCCPKLLYYKAFEN